MAKNRAIAKSLEIGRDMAAAALKRRRKAAATRRDALADRARMVARREGPAAAAAVRAGSAGVLVAEGDSWFDYPFTDVLNELEDNYGFDVESVAHRGDTVEEMAYAGGQLDSFARRLEKVLNSGRTPKGVLLSGGGNDVAGDEFALLLNHARSGHPGLNDPIVTGVIDIRAYDAYATIIAAITAISEGLTRSKLPIVVHGYDYPVPDGRGFAGGWWLLPGPWLEPGFQQKGYPQMVQRRPIVNALIDRFNTMLGGLTSQAPFGHVRYVDLRKTLSTGTDYKKDWANELHPTQAGFAKVAAKIAAAL